MPERRSLPAQLILSFFGVVILTALTIALSGTPVTARLTPRC
jgi:hypothetical protein